MKVCIYGAGAIGGHLATRMAHAGADISVIARGPHLAAIQANGLTVRAPDGTHHARVTATGDPAELGPQDIVLVTVKAPGLNEVAARIAPLLTPETMVVFVMNGIPWWYFQKLGGAHDGRRLERLDPGDAVLNAIGAHRTIGGVVYAASAVVAPGVIEVEQTKSRLIVGEIDGTITPRIDALAALIRKGGIGGVLTPSIRTEIWAKLLSNLAGGALAVLTGAAPKAAYADPVVVDAARRAMQETIAIARALGCNLQVDPEDRIANGRAMDHKPSILQDLELGRRMEIDQMFDAPTVLARLAGVRTPTLDLLVALCKIRARGAGLYGE